MNQALGEFDNELEFSYLNYENYTDCLIHIIHLGFQLLHCDATGIPISGSVLLPDSDLRIRIK